MDRVAGLLVGADDYMVKPFAPDELVARVWRSIARTTDAIGDGKQHDLVSADVLAHMVVE